MLALLIAACDVLDDGTVDDTTTTTERIEVLDSTITTIQRVIARDEPIPSVLRVARHNTSTIVTTTTSTTTTSTTTTTTTPGTPLVPFPDVPPLSIFETARTKAVHVVSDPYTIDPETCEGVIWTAKGSDWSAFAVVAPTADDYCEIWLGGQRDNPDYTGNPFLYCLVPEAHDPVTVDSDKTAAWVSEPGLCAPTGFDQG